MTPLISIIIPTYNRSTFIPATLDSIINQKYSNWELVIVDDGSRTETKNLLKEYSKKDDRIHIYYRESTKKGAPVCRNEGFQKSSGDYIIFLDSDDMLKENCLENRLSCFENHKDIDVTVSLSFMVTGSYSDNSSLVNCFTEEDDVLRFLRNDNPWYTGCVMLKREVVQEIGGWNEQLLRNQDVEFSIRWLTGGWTYKRLAIPDCYYRNHKNESISRNPNKTKALLESDLLFHSRVYHELKQSDSLKRAFVNFKAAIRISSQPMDVFEKLNFAQKYVSMIGNDAPLWQILGTILFVHEPNRYRMHVLSKVWGESVMAIYTKGNTSYEKKASFKNGKVCYENPLDLK